MAEEAKAKEEPKERCKLKSGEYQVHIYLEEGRGIVPEEEGDTVDAIIAMTVFGSTKYSAVKDDISAGATLFWGEHFFFNKSNLDVKEVENSKILIEIKNHRTLLSDSLIGNYEMDLSYPYFKDKHALVHQWIAFCNPESEEFHKVRGHLKIGICVQAEGDDDVDLTVKETGEPKDSDVLLPPQVNLQSVQLVVRVIKAEGLPKMDGWNGTIDAFCSAEFAGAKIKTSAVEADSKKFTAYWNEDLFLPATVPPLSSKVMFRVWDYDIGSSDDLVGSMTFLWKDIADGKYSDYFWTNIYGAPKDLDNDEATKMNETPEIASKWRGRILLRVNIEHPEKPHLDVKKIEDEDLSQFIRENYEAITPYEIRCQIFSGSVLSPEFSEYSVSVLWSGKETATKELECVNSTCVWNEVLKRKIVKLPRGAEEEMPDIFVVLKNDDDRLSYARLSVKDWQDINGLQKWVNLCPDKAVNRIKNEWEGGMVLIRLFVGVFNAEHENLSIGKWNIPPRPRKGETIKIVSNIYQCRNLPAADSDGKSDPYIKVHCLGQEARTEMKENTLNPMWYERLIMEIPSLDLSVNPPIVVYVFDHDDITADDLIGMVTLNLSSAQLDSDTATDPVWTPLLLGKSSCGEVLVSFNLYKEMEIPEYSIVPECIDVEVEINSLGLRDLHPAIGWMPVNKPFIKFDLNSLQIPGENLMVRNVETTPSETGANPNISAVIQFSCKMPVDELFSPVLTATVYDVLFKGLSQPQIGTFTIDLGRIFHTKKKSQKLIIPKVHKQPPPEVKEIQEQYFNNEGPVERAITRPTLEEAMNDGFVMYPEYGKDKKGKLIEISKPGGDFMQVGYDRKEGDHIMHYRYLLDDELENTEYIDKSPFDKFSITKGQDHGLEDNWFSMLFANKNADGQPSTLRETGIFKGLVKVTDVSKFSKKENFMQNLVKSKKMKKANDSHPLKLEDIGEIKIKSSVDLNFEEMKRLILKKTTLIVRVYILECLNLAQKDWKSNSDPFIRIKLHKQVIDDSDNYQEDEPNPKIHRHFDLKTELPGASRLKIQVWDKDPIVSDEKIGETVIDLEDRFFSGHWRNMREKPIETRGLFLKSSKMQQGSIRMWLELIDPGNAANPRDISLRPPAEFEVRLIIWKTKGVANYDVEATSDIYVRAWVNDSEPKETDTHFRCQNGKAHFNWRMKFKLLLPNEHCYCNVQLWDRDVISFSDFIGDASFEFSELAKTAFEKQARIKKQREEEGLFDSERPDKVWVNCTRRKDDGTDEDAGEVLISLEIVPKASAEVCPVGEGRDEPNVDPFLPPPLGRFKWSWNPCTLISQTCGPSFRIKICCAICCIICCYLCVLMFPMIISSFMATAASEA